MTTFIGIAGTHSTGKTTFVTQVQEEAGKLGIAVEVVRDTATRCQEAGFPILQNHTFESTLWIVASVIRAELEAGLKAKLVLVDRPVPDALGYLEAALHATGRAISQAQRDYLYVLAQHHAGRYALLLKTKLDESIPLGEGRDPNLEFRRDADRRISGVFRQLGVAEIDPNSDTAQQRLRALLGQLA